MKGKISDVHRAKHILDAITEIEKYLMDKNFSEYEQDSMLQSATERQLTIIGEACNALTEETKNLFPEINWRGIRGFRNIVIHEYFGVSVRMIWGVVVKELPELKRLSEKIIEDVTFPKI